MTKQKLALWLASWLRAHTCSDEEGQTIVRLDDEVDCFILAGDLLGDFSEYVK